MKHDHCRHRHRIVVLVVAAMAVRIIKQYEQGVLFRFGRVLGAAGPACG